MSTILGLDKKKKAVYRLHTAIYKKHTLNTKTQKEWKEKDEEIYKHANNRHKKADVAMLLSGQNTLQQIEKL